MDDFRAHDNSARPRRRLTSREMLSGLGLEPSMVDRKKGLPADDDTRVWPDVSYLRQQARRCVSLSRECPHQETARALEMLGVELLEKSVELELLQEQLKLWKPLPN